MITVRDYALDTFEAALATLCGVYEGSGLTREEIHGALRRRLRETSSPISAAPFDPAQPPKGREVYVEVPRDGGADGQR